MQLDLDKAASKRKEGESPAADWTEAQTEADPLSLFLFPRLPLPRPVALMITSRGWSLGVY